MTKSWYVRNMLCRLILVAKNLAVSKLIDHKTKIHFQFNQVNKSFFNNSKGLKTDMFSNISTCSL